MKNDSPTNQHRCSPSLFPSFFRTNNVVSNSHLPSVQESRELSNSRKECLVFPPKESRCDLTRKNGLCQVLYEHLHPYQSHRNGIVTLDFEGDAHQRTVQHVRKELRQYTRKQESRSISYQPESKPQPGFVCKDPSALVRRVLNQRELTARKKYIDTHTNSVAYERERFRELLQKEREQKRLSRQKSIEQSSINQKVMHERCERVRLRRKRHPLAWAEGSLQFETVCKPERRPIDRYASINLQEEIRPWTNSLAEAEQQQSS